jgi:hypothetical protein
MYFSAAKILATLLLVATGVSASSAPQYHRRIGRRTSRKLVARHGRHNCGGNPSSSSSEIASSTDIPSSTDTPTTTDTPTSTVDQPTSTESAAPSPSSNGATIEAFSDVCGSPNGVADPAPTSGPNGDQNWLNCGVDSDQGWQPPPVTLQNMVYKDLATVLEQDGNVFSACKDYLHIFETMSSETGIPTILLASIALQESGCRPDVTGGAGEIGMMQITGEKCPQGYPDASCYDAETNIRIGAEYMKKMIDQSNGNVVQAMGYYNGWRQGMTVFDANNYAICAQHNNLDYIQNVFNGYIQGVDPSSINMGIYHNTC